MSRLRRSESAVELAEGIRDLLAHTNVPLDARARVYQGWLEVLKDNLPKKPRGKKGESKKSKAGDKVA